MKKRWISIAAVAAFAVLVAGAAYAHVDRSEWCTGNSGMSHRMGSASGHMMGPGAGHMGPTNGRMSANTGHMGGSSSDHMAARHDGEIRNFDCPGPDAGSTGEGSN